MSPLRPETGQATAEYAVGMLAALAFAVLLWLSRDAYMQLVTSSFDQVRAWLPHGL